MIVYSDDENQATYSAYEEDNPAIEITGISDTPSKNQRYLDKTHSTCEKLNVNVLSHEGNKVTIKHLGKNRCLIKNQAYTYVC